MAVAKFNWHSTNPNKAFQGKDPPANAAAMINFNATAAETERAYNALKNHGPVSDFKTEVWNDICAKIYDVSDEWGVNQIYRKSTAWNPFIHTPNRTQWENYAKKTWPELSQDEYWLEEWVNKMFDKYGPGKFRPWNYNVVYSQWLVPLGLTPFEVKKGQRLKGEYILKLVEYVNHWIDLSPLDIRAYVNFQLTVRMLTTVLRSVTIQPDVLEMILDIYNNADLDDSILATVELCMVLLMNDLDIAELRSCALSSLINFMMLRVKCTVWDKIPIYTEFVLAMLYDASVTFALLPPVYLQINQQSTFNMSAKGDLASFLDVLSVYLEMQLKQKALADMASAYGFSLSTHHGQHRGEATLRLRTPMHISISDDFTLNGIVLVEHQGTLLLFMEDGSISFVDNNSLVVHDAVQGTHSGNIGINNEIELGGNTSAALIPEDGNIIYHADTFDGLSAKAIKSEHKSSFGLESDQEFDQSIATPMNLNDKIRGMVGGAEISFANEQDVVTKDSTTSIVGTAILAKDPTFELYAEAVASAYSSVTIEKDPTIEAATDAISTIIGNADIRKDATTEMTSESTASAYSSATVDKNAAIEAAAESIIKSLQSSELFFGLNAILDVEIVAAKISSVAAMESSKYCWLDSGIEVSTIENVIADKVLRKLLDSDISVETKIKASIVTSLIRFAESTNNVTKVDTSSKLITCLSSKSEGVPQYIRSQIEAILDTRYTMDSSIDVDAKMCIIAEAIPSFIVNSTYLAAIAIVDILYEAQLQRVPPRQLSSNIVAESSSEASATLARSVLVLASDLEDMPIGNCDNTLAIDFERKLIFN
jgi:hypothetical protein